MNNDPGRVGANTSPGHLSVHVEGEHPADVPFLFEQRGKERLGKALMGALAYHATIVIVVVLAGRVVPQIAPAVLPEKANDSIIWLAEEGPGGGGGGGGNEMEEPPRQAELPGEDELTVPAVKPPTEAPPPEVKAPEPDPLAQLTIPAVTLAAGVESLPGVLEMPPGPPTPSRGSGSGGGAGTGQGTGIGAGQGSGLGPGFGGGTGGGAYQPGNGVTVPVVLREVKPQYTSEAMRARIQGTVWVECVVRTDGTVGDVEVVRSLDPRFGLDEEAIKAARQWRFRPGMRLGEPVPVLVTIELTFTLR